MKTETEATKAVDKYIKIKICGMRDPANIRTVATLCPDYLGFIEYARSPRFVGQNFRTPELPPSIFRVGVFVDETVEIVEARIRAAGYNAIQLHGDEAPDFCARIRDQGIRVIKVFRIDDEFDFAATKAYLNNVDVLLFDARGRQPGGNGIRFNPDVLSRYDQQIPFFLSGGLQPETLGEDMLSLSGMNLYGVDLNSGVELAPGMKDAQRVRSSIQHVRGIKPPAS